MSKYAVRAFAESVDHEWAGRGVSVVHIAPGFVASEIRRVDRRGALHADAKDPVPAWLVCPAERAARQMADAVARRAPLCVVTGHGKALTAIARFAPGLLRRALRLAGSRVKRKGDALTDTR